MSMDREIDKKVIKGDRMRIINIHEIGSNTRDKQEHSDMKFEADIDEPKADLTTEAPTVQAVDDQVPEVVIHDNATDPNIGAISQHQQDSLQYLHDDPHHFLNHEVTKNWVQDGGEISYTGIIYDVDDDHLETGELFCHFAPN